MKHRKEKDYDEDDDDAEAFQYHAAVRQSSDEVQSIVFFCCGTCFLGVYGRLLFMFVSYNEEFSCIVAWRPVGCWLVPNTQFGPSKDFLLELEANL